MSTTEIRNQVAVGANENILSAAYVNNTTYEIVDSDARVGVKANSELIDQISGLIQGGVHYLGKTTTELSDGSTQQTVVIGSKSVTAADGDMVSYDAGKAHDLEFIWGSGQWNEFGSSGALKALAFKDEASATYTPAGFVGISATTIGDLPVTNASAEFNSVSVAAQLTLNSYTPAGTISCGNYTPAGNVSVNNIVVGDKTISVAEVSSATFSGTAFAVPSAFVGTAATLTPTTSEGKGDVTSNGTLDKLPALTATGSVNALTAVGSSSAAAGSASVTNGVLSFNFNNVLTSVSTTTADVAVTVTPSYTDTLTAVTDIAVSAKANMLTSVTVNNIEYTPAGTFQTKNVTPSGDITVGKKDVEKTVSIGTLSATATFSGTAAALKADFAGTAKAPTGSVSTTEFTPSLTAFSGKVTVPEHSHNAGFGGTQATITVS